MEVRNDAVHTDVAEVWVRRQQEITPMPRVKPLVRPEASVARKEDSENRQEKKQEGLKGLERGTAKEVAEKTQAFLDDLNIRLDFEVYEKTGDMVVRIFNRETEELIREIPPEELLKVHQKLVELRGVLFDEKA